MTDTPASLDALEALLAKATPGEWRVEDDTTLIWGACAAKEFGSYGMGYPVTECKITPSGNWAKGPCADEGEANAAAIVGLRNAAPDLIAKARRVDELEAALRRLARGKYDMFEVCHLSAREMRDIARAALKENTDG